MKKMNKENKSESNKRLCEKCAKLFNEEDLDVEDGEWVCRECEDHR